jgi:hypothetical protein
MNRVTIIVEKRRSKLLGCLGVVLVIGVLGTFLSPDSDDPNSTSRSTKPGAAKGHEVEQQNPKIDIRRYIKQQILADKVLDLKISFDIVLHEKPTEPELRLLAQSLLDQYRNKYERVFIVYYLPGMVINAGGWAISHHRPDSAEMDFQILGLSRESEDSLRSAEIPREWNVFGRWIDDKTTSGMLTVFHASGRLQLETRYADNSAGIRRIKTIKVNGLDGFEETEGVIKDKPARWLITSNGHLQQMESGDRFGEEFDDPLTPCLSIEGIKYRVWQDTSGTFEVEAEFTKEDNTTITLKRRDDGSEIVVKTEDLSTVDRQWLHAEKLRQRVQYKIEPASG